MTAVRRLMAALAAVVPALLTPHCQLARAAGGAIPVTLHARGGAQGIDWPLTFGVPFPDEALKDEAKVRLIGPDGAGVPIQVRTTGRWLSGSISWVLIDTQRPLPQGEASYRVEWGDGVVRGAARSDRVTIRDGDRAVTVDTGPLRFTLSKDNLNVFSEILVRGGDGEMRPVFPEGTQSDLFLEDHKGTAYLGSLATAPEVKIEEGGPRRVSVKLEGWMQSEDGRKLGRRIVRVQAFAGKRWLRVTGSTGRTAAWRSLRLYG